MYRIKKQLLKALEAELIEGINELNEEYKAVQLLPELKKQYPTQLREEIVSVRLYQTDMACFLEITNLYPPNFKEREMNEMIEGDYSRKSYISERTSLSFASDEDGVFFKPSATALENAYIFLEEYDDRSKLETTNLFSEEGSKDLIALIKELENDDESEKSNYGELTYNEEQLKQMDGYFSVDDPDSLDTPFMYYKVNEGNFLIYLNEGTDHTDNNPFEKFVFPPDWVECSFRIFEKTKIWHLSIPLYIVKQVKIESERHYYEEYNIPEEYSCIINLTDDNKIEIKGKFEEFTPNGKMLPEIWFFIHEVHSSKGS